MARTPRDYADVHRAARGFEARLARAVRRSLDKIRDGVSINDLAAALAAKDVRRALALLPRSFVEDALKPAGSIAADAVDRGRRIGAKQVRKARG